MAKHETILGSMGEVMNASPSSSTSRPASSTRVTAFFNSSIKTHTPTLIMSPSIRKQLYDRIHQVHQHHLHNGPQQHSEKRTHNMVNMQARLGQSIGAPIAVAVTIDTDT